MTRPAPASLPLSAVTALLARDMRIHLRQGADLAAGLIFALLVVALFPFALSPAPEELQRLAPGLILIAFILAQFLGMERLFAADLADGTLDLVVLARVPLPLYALAKAAGHAASHVLPLLLAAPLFMLLLNMPLAAMGAALLALALASLILTLLGAAGSALILGSRQPGLLLPLILIPFTVPVLIFAAGLARDGLGGSGEGMQSLYFLGGLFCLYLVLAPLIAGSALKGAVETT